MSSRLPSSTDAAVTDPVRLVSPRPDVRLAAVTEASERPPLVAEHAWREVIGWTSDHAALSRGRKIGLVDTAVAPGSPLLPDDAVIQRYRFDDDGLAVCDHEQGRDDGHGTRSAATILAVAPHAELHAFALPDSFRRGAGSPLELLVAVSELAIRGVEVICLNVASRSFAGFVNAFAAPEAAIDALRRHLDALEYYRAVGQLLQTTIVNAPLIVTGTGNDSRPGVRLPAAQPGPAWGALTVGAIGPDRAVHDFSHAGASVVAPGDVMLATGRVFRGTSAAAALTAGAAALWAGARSLYGRREQLRAHLIANARADLVAGASPPEDIGAGVVRVPPLGP